MIPTPSEITYFIELFRTRHLSNSAIRLGITQPTLSQSLQRLEEKVGSKLFFRTKRGIIPTDFGNAFFLRAKALIDAWEGVSSDLKNEEEGISGKFRVGCHSAVGAYTIPKLLQQMSRVAPKVSLELVHDFSRKVTERIVSFELHFGYVVNPTRHPDLTLVKLADDQVCFWKKKGLRHVPKRLITDSNLMQVEEMMTKSQAKVFQGWSRIQTTSLELVRTLVSCGEGVGIIPTRVANFGHTPLEVFDANVPSFHDEIYLAYRKEMLHTPSGKKLIELAKNVLT